MKKKFDVEPLMEFLGNTPTPFHAVKNLTGLLQASGFTELKETQKWETRAGGKYFVQRNGSALVAFIVGKGKIAETGFRMVGAHTDSPCLRLKPNAEIPDPSYLRLDTEVYGSAILSTWFDRDLSLAGRLCIAKGNDTQSVLVDFERPIACLPNLAIHLDRTINEKRTINRQTEMLPIAGHALGRDLRLEDILLEEVSKQGGERLLSHELYFYDTQKPALIGLQSEFLASSRLDNLLSCFVGTAALIQASSPEASCVLVCSDHEEVGSGSSVGAQGPFLKSVLERLVSGTEDWNRAMAHSILVSTDNAHGIHPNYPYKHDGNHAPLLNHGVVLKTNFNQRYATNSETAAIFLRCCASADAPVQNFVSRNDVPCGSTIGPITATVLGVRAVDVGVPTFAMHSIRELSGTADAGYLQEALAEFFGRKELD